MNAKTTIALDMETRDRLAKAGEKRESYDTIVRRLLDQQDHNKTFSIEYVEKKNKKERR